VREPSHPEHPLSIIQGVTGPTSTQLAVIVPAPLPVLGVFQSEFTFTLTADTSPGATIPPAKSFEVRKFKTSWKVMRLIYTGLSPGTTYTFTVRKSDGNVVDSRSLTTLDTQSRRPFRFLVTSCMDDGYPEEQARQWAGVAAARPDLIFLIGDNVYADKEGNSFRALATPDVLWERYHETLTKIDLYHFAKLIPVFPTWDDHDFGKNDSDISYPYKTESKDTFEAYFPRETLPELEGIFSRGPGVASRLDAFGMTFFLMDDRMFRTPLVTHWGEKQEAWLLSGLSGLTRPVVLLNGDQFFGGYQPAFESFEGNHPENFKRFIGRLKSVRAPIVFASGDRHLSELMEIPASVLGYKTYEFTSSAIHALQAGKFSPGYWDKYPNPYRIEGSPEFMNYTIVEVSQGVSPAESAPGAPLRFKVTAYTDGTRVIYSRDLTVSRDAPHIKR
jgi:hypothetical protein